jgi:glycosyltransferase involved in cell wall biosynthesis
MKTALVYDRVNKWGGAERVLLALHEIFPEAPLYTSVYDSKRASWASVFPEIKTSFLQKFPFAKSNHEFLGTLMPLAFESFDFSDFDLVISITSEAAKGIITKPGTIHICYLLTSTRYLWSHNDEYFKGTTFKAIAKPFVDYLRKWDKIAANRPDKIIAISTEVKNRIEKYYNRKSNIIFPPVNTSIQYNIEVDSCKKYYLLVSRLVKYKKVDLAIKAFNNLGYPLIVVGTGREEHRLKSKSKKNIKFVGKVSDKELAGYYKYAKALIMPQEEDFGIVSVEAQIFGVPVIAYKKGGVLDTVIPGKTGFLFDSQTVDSLEDSVKLFEINGDTIKSKDCKNNAKRFSKERFKKEFVDFVKDVRMK